METTVPSPSGRFEVRVSPWEARMSLWVETPTVVDTATGRELLAFADVRWSLDEAEWVSDSVVELWLRKYPGSHRPPGVMVTVDCDGETAQIGEATVPFREVERTLDQALTWPQPPAPEPPRGFVGILQRLYRLWRGAS